MMTKVYSSIDKIADLLVKMAKRMSEFLAKRKNTVASTTQCDKLLIFKTF